MVDTSSHLYYLLGNKIAVISPFADDNQVIYKDLNVPNVDLDSQTILTTKSEFYVNSSGNPAYTNQHLLLNLNNFSYEEKSQMKQGRQKHTLTEIIPGTHLLVTGGSYEGKYLNSCEVYNILSKSWEQYGELNEARSNHICFVFKDQIYVFGGIHGDVSDSSAYVSSIETYNKQNSKWEIVSIKTSLSVYPVFSNSSLLFSNDNQEVFLIFGDRDNKGERNNEIVSFNPVSLELSATEFKLGNSNWFYRHIYFKDSQNRHNFLSRNGHLHRFDPKASNTWEYIREFVVLK